VQHFPGLFWTQASIEQKDFEACAQRGAGFASLPYRRLFLALVDTMYIMLS